MVWMISFKDKIETVKKLWRTHRENILKSVYNFIVFGCKL